MGACIFHILGIFIVPFWLVLMDEPSVGLSPVMEAEIAKIIKTINA
jgi:ABC-type branched-subunit amino acid transport system ATPase component